MSATPWLDVARRHLGEREVAGPKHNPTIVGWLRRVTGRDHPDETAWCAAFVGACLMEVGLPSTGKLAARSYAAYGEPLDGPREGCIVVLVRGDPKSWQGHVGFYVGRVPDGRILILGGNQGNAVSIARYDPARVLAWRWPAAAPVPPAPRPATDVRSVQRRLIELGYHEVGAVDGVVGTRTRGAILAFRADAGLPLEPVVDDALLSALMRAQARPVAAERANAGPEAVADHAAVREAGKASWVGRILALVGLGGLTETTGVLDGAERVTGWLGRVRGVLAPVWDVVAPLWPLAAIAAGVAVWIWVRRIRDEEVESYRQGETP